MSFPRTYAPLPLRRALFTPPTHVLLYWTCSCLPHPLTRSGLLPGAPFICVHMPTCAMCVHNVQCPRQRMHACVCLARDKKKKTLGAQIGSSLNRNLRKFSLSHCYHRNRLTPIALLRKPAESHRVAKETRCTMVLEQPVVPVSNASLSHELGS